VKPLICTCCSEPMTEEGHTHSCNPNVCASCFNILDEKQERNTPADSVVSLKKDVHATGVIVYARIRH
jgi:hypothetical protein